MSERTHRHKLEKNELADWLGEKYEVLRPYAIHLTVGGLVIVAAVIGAIFYFSQDSAGGPRGWQAYFAAFGEKKVEDALKAAAERPEVKGTPAELWAKLAYADQQFGLTAFRTAQDPSETKTALADAEKVLLDIEGKATDRTLLERCRFTLARIYETQNKPNKAREYYQKVAESSKDSAIGKAAVAGAARLDPQAEAGQVIAWLAEQKPLPRPTPGSGNSPFGLGPAFGPAPQLPRRPNLNVPDTFRFGGESETGIDFGRDDPLGTKGAVPDETAPEGTAPTKSGDKTPKRDAKEEAKPTDNAKSEKKADEKPAEAKPPVDKP